MWNFDDQEKEKNHRNKEVKINTTLSCLWDTWDKRQLRSIKENWANIGLEQEKGYEAGWKY